MRKLWIVGHAGEYGGASSELRHQIHLWNKAFPEIELHTIPTQQGWKNEPLYKEMLNIGMIYHDALDFSDINKDDAVINFCSSEFLYSLKEINQKTKRVAWANCMSWCFPLEVEAAKEKLIKLFLYQRPQILEDHKAKLVNGEFLHFSPYFNSDGWETSKKESEFTNIGRISRQDTDKFSKDVLHIYEYIVSPKEKRGHFLGFDARSEKKIGKPMNWVKTYRDQKALPVKDFYKQVDFIVQSTDTKENWPRIGFEAMYSGVPLIVDNRGGWQYMIEHGVTGFLCNHARDFIYWGSRMAYEPELREQIATNARAKADELGGYEVSKESWSKVFEKLFS